MGLNAASNLVKMPFVSSANFSCVSGGNIMLLGKVFQRHSRFVIGSNLKNLFFRYFSIFSSGPSFPSPSVSCVFNDGNPFAVFRTIVSVWVRSIYCQMLLIARFLCPKHKWNKTNPIVANGYSSGSVPSIIKTIFVKASVFHAVPNSIKSSLVHPVGLRSSHFILHKCFYYTLKGA